MLSGLEFGLSRPRPRLIPGDGGALDMRMGKRRRAKGRRGKGEGEEEEEEEE